MPKVLEKMSKQQVRKNSDFVIEKLQGLLIEDDNLYLENCYDSDSMEEYVS